MEASTSKVLIVVTAKVSEHAIKTIKTVSENHGVEDNTEELEKILESRKIPAPTSKKNSFKVCVDQDCCPPDSNCATNMREGLQMLKDLKADLKAQSEMVVRNREAAAEDRKAATEDRKAAAKDRETAYEDRLQAFQDRLEATQERGEAKMDRALRDAARCSAFAGTTCTDPAEYDCTPQ